MNGPPLVLRLIIPGENGTLRLWLPLFLVYPFLAVLALILLPLVLIAALILWPMGWSKTIILAGPYLLRTICALRGLEVDIKQQDKHLLVYFK